jgi:hypothetical protein
MNRFQKAWTGSSGGPAWNSYCDGKYTVPGVAAALAEGACAGRAAAAGVARCDASHDRQRADHDHQRGGPSAVATTEFVNLTHLASFARERNAVAPLPFLAIANARAKTTRATRSIGAIGVEFSAAQHALAAL